MKKKQVFLSFDIETIVSRRSRNLDFKVTVTQGALEIARLLRERGLKGTFFISLSAKDLSLNSAEYLKEIRNLILCLKGFENIDIQPHIHALNLPVSFECPSDSFADYNLQQQTEMLIWAKEFFAEVGVQVSGFRSGSYLTGDSYYQALEMAGYSFSSLMNTSKTPNIDLINKTANSSEVISKVGDIKEFNVTTVKVKSIKPGVIEQVNLSPDFFTINSVKYAFKDLDCLNINFHSFSMFSNRLARENHEGQLRNNLCFYLLQKPLIKLADLVGLKAYSPKTIFNQELNRWLDEFTSEQYETRFYSEV